MWLHVPLRQDYDPTEQELYQVGFDEYYIEEVPEGIYIEYQSKNLVSGDNFAVTVIPHRKLLGKGCRKYRNTVLEVYDWYKKATEDELFAHLLR